MPLSQQRGGGKKSHEILGNFADNCGWLLGREVWRVWGEGSIFLPFWRSTCTESKSLFPKTCKCFAKVFDFCFTASILKIWENSRGQLEEVEFPGVFMKNSCGISMVLVFDVEISKHVTPQFCRISNKDKILFSLDFLRVKWHI